MKVRMCVSIAGLPEPKYELGMFSFSPGDVVDLHEDLAQAWLANGHAEAIEAVSEPETKRPRRSKAKE